MSRAPSRASSPTSFDDLNELLDEFVERVRALLGEDFVGAYLVGSFALGAGDEWSDADFVVVTQHDPEPAPLNELHAELFARDNRWARHLEGSYLPRDLIRRVDPARTKVWFLDHGSQELVRDDHCNTALIRWTLREHPVVLAGPDPRTLVDPVEADDLRAEARRFVREYAEWAAGLDGLNRWHVVYIPLTFARLHYTLATGTIGTKETAGRWALEHFDPQLHDAIRDALANRADPVGRWFTPASPDEAARTRALVEAMR